MYPRFAYLSSTSASTSNSDPVRATLLAILKQLNQAESAHEGRDEEQALELAELEGRLSGFWAVERKQVKVPLALGLLLRNRLVSTQGRSDYSWQRRRNVAQRYRITPEGKKFLVDALVSSDRVM